MNLDSRSSSYLGDVRSDIVFMCHATDSVCVPGPCFTRLCVFAILLLLLLLSEYAKEGEEGEVLFSLAKVMFCSFLVLYLSAVWESFL